MKTQTPERPTGSYQLRVRDVRVAVAPTISGFGQSTMDTTIVSWIPGNKILGNGFNGTTSVTIGGVTAQHWVTSDSVIDFLLPAVASVGDLEVVVTNGFGSDTAMLTVTPPATPTLFATGSLGPAGEMHVRVGLPPGTLGALFVSESPRPTLLPGVAALELGSGGAALRLLERFEAGPAGLFEMRYPVPAAALPGQKLYLQCVSVDPSAPGPWPTTNRVLAYL